MKPRPPLRSYASFDRTDWTTTYEKQLRETSFMKASARQHLKYGTSLDHGRQYTGSDFPPFMMKKPKRAPLVHAKCFDESTEFELAEVPTRGLRREKPLSAEEASLIEEDEGLSGSTKLLSKSDECCLLGDENFSLDCDKESGGKVLRTQLSIDIVDSVNSSYERNYRNRANEYFYERAVTGPSANYAESVDYSTRTTSSGTLTTTALVHNNSLETEKSSTVAESPPITEVTFRQNRLQGTSETSQKKKFIKQNRVQRLSSSSLQVVQGVRDSSLSRLFDRQKYFGSAARERLEKSKRLSTSALYDKSPTEQLYKSKSGSGGRLSSIQLFEKFCSEDFGSLYSDSQGIDFVDESYEDDEEDYNYYNSAPNYPVFNFYENPLDRESVTALYERFCVAEGADGRNNSSSTSHETTITSSSGGGGAIRKQYSRDQDNVFTFDSPQPPTQPTTPLKISLDCEDNPPLLSRGSETETSFNDDFISSFNDDFYISSIADDMLLSPTLEGTLIEDQTESSNITELQTVIDHKTSDQYEPCLNVHLQPKRRSIKKQMLKQHSWNLENLKFKPIDDDSDNDIDDAFQTDPIYPQANLANIDETNSIEHNSSKTSPSEQITTLEIPCTIATRLSMSKLQPFCCHQSNVESNEVVEVNNKHSIICKQQQQQIPKSDIKIVQKHNKDQLQPNQKSASSNKSPNKVVDINSSNVNPEVQNNSKSIFFRVRRDKQANAVTVHRKTRCFPL